MPRRASTWYAFFPWPRGIEPWYGEEDDDEDQDLQDDIAEMSSRQYHKKTAARLILGANAFPRPEGGRRRKLKRGHGPADTGRVGVSEDAQVICRYKLKPIDGIF
jgi:hypothetical protein